MVLPEILTSAILGGIIWDFIKNGTIITYQKIRDTFHQKGYYISEEDSRTLEKTISYSSISKLADERSIVGEILKDHHFQEILSRVNQTVTQSNNTVDGDLAAGDIIKDNEASTISTEIPYIQKLVNQNGNQVKGDMSGSNIIKGNKIS